MPISKETLIDLLVEKTGLEKEQVTAQLDELVTRIYEVSKEGRSFKIRGFGTFEMQEGKLHFEPDKSLEIEINHKYTGMSPIELIGAFKDTPDVAINREQKAETPAPEKAEPPQSEQIEEKELAATDDPLEKEQEEILFENEESSFEFDEDVSEETTPSPEDQKTEEPATQEPEEVEEEQAAPEETQPEPVLAQEEPVASEKTGDSKKKEEESDPIGKFLVAAVIVVAIGVSGWFIYDFGLLDSFIGNGNGNTNPTEQRVQNVGPPSSVNQDKKPVKDNLDSLKPDSEQKKDNDVPKSVSVAEQSRQSIYGLRGGAVPEAQSGYTIVVHSLRSKAKAEEMEQNLRSEGYLTILTSGVVRGTTRWRVGLGQFKNIEDAQKAINDLPVSYKQNNFIRKF